MWTHFLNTFRCRSAATSSFEFCNDDCSERSSASVELASFSFKSRMTLDFNRRMLGLRTTHAQASGTNSSTSRSLFSVARRSSFDGACCCVISFFSRMMSRSGPRRPSGIVGTEGVASAGVGDDIAYRMDMRFLILSSTRDLRAFLSGLDSLAAGLGPLRDEALLRRDSIVDVESLCSRPGDS